MLLAATSSNLIPPGRFLYSGVSGRIPPGRFCVVPVIIVVLAS